jgi:hypothetical protein
MTRRGLSIVGRKLLPALSIAVGLTAVAVVPAQARTSVGIGLGFGFPIYPAPAYYPPPPVYYPPPPVYYPPPAYAPPSAYVAPPGYQQPALGAVQPQSTGYSRENCREYQSNQVIDGKMQTVIGTACLQPDGSWRIVQ